MEMEAKPQPIIDEPMDLTPLSIRIMELRHSRGLSLYELEKRTGIDRSNLRKIETGMIKLPTKETMEKIAKALGRPLEYFSYDYYQMTGIPFPKISHYLPVKYPELTPEEVSKVSALVYELWMPHLSHEQIQRLRDESQVNWHADEAERNSKGNADSAPENEPTNA
jgi:transcriptional regulator with XRE-family HTH domain